VVEQVSTASPWLEGLPKKQMLDRNDRDRLT